MKNDMFEMLNYTGESRNVQYMSTSSYRMYSTLRLLPHEVTTFRFPKKKYVAVVVKTVLKQNILQTILPKAMSLCRFRMEQVNESPVPF